MADANNAADIKLADLQRIYKALPHRYPFLMVDRVVEFAKDESIVAIKNISNNEPQFPGHFPGFPVMPGVLLLEAMAQACGMLLFLSSGEEARTPNQLFFLTGVDDVRFRKMVLPGDQVVLKATCDRQRRGFYTFKTEGWVDDALVCQAKIIAALSDKTSAQDKK